MDTEKPKHINHGATTAIDLPSETFDTSSVSTESTLTPNNGLRRGLKARHIQMIALGGTIGKVIYIYQYMYVCMY